MHEKLIERNKSLILTAQNSSCTGSCLATTLEHTKFHSDLEKCFRHISNLRFPTHSRPSASELTIFALGTQRNRLLHSRAHRTTAYGTGQIPPRLTQRSSLLLLRVCCRDGHLCFLFTLLSQEQRQVFLHPAQSTFASSRTMATVWGRQRRAAGSAVSLGVQCLTQRGGRAAQQQDKLGNRKV